VAGLPRPGQRGGHAAPPGRSRVTPLRRDRTQGRLFYEDYRVGAAVRTAGHVVTAEQIAVFAMLTGEVNPIHLTLDGAREAGYDDIVAPVLLVQSIALGLIAGAEATHTTTISLLGVTMRSLAPTYPGDQIRVDARVVRKRSRKDPTVGLLYRELAVVNQHERTVVEGRLVSLMRRRPAAGTPRAAGSANVRTP
jgi:acyl dehydratase